MLSGDADTADVEEWLRQQGIREEDEDYRVRIGLISTKDGGERKGSDSEMPDGW